MSKPSIPRGTRDFSPIVMAKRKYILHTIEKIYQSFGFMPLETPAMENLTTLTGKYGDEGDQLVFKVIESGDYLKNHRVSFENVSLFVINYSHLLTGLFMEFTSNNFINISYENKLSDGIEKLFQYNLEDKDIIQNFFIENKNRIIYEFKEIKKTSDFKYSEQEIYRELLKTYLDKYSDNFLVSNKATKLITEKGLRYDLTVPLARYVVMNQHEVSFPFKRYQMQPVWRADRPQKGRYREFWQCDADVLGTNSLLCEADFIQIYQQVFSKLGLNGYEIRINHRKLLEAVVEKANASTHFKTITVIIDKADKIGIEGVKNELLILGLNTEQVEVILSLLEKHQFNAETIQKIALALPNTDNALKAIADLETLLNLLNHETQNVYLDGSLARGLDYYTGCIFEVVPTEVKMGSISGGGRYDDLTGIFGLKDISGIGISFGIDRIYDVMEELQLFPSENTNFTDVLFCPMDNQALQYCIPLAANLRSKGYKVEIYPTAAKLKKQLDYANAKNIKWTAIVGESEMQNNQVALKNLISGEQEMVDKHFWS